MRRAIARSAALMMLVAVAPAPADIVLEGHFHTGDEDTKTEFTPLDPVDCAKYRTYPTRFHLTQSATITGFTLHDAVDTQNSTITADIDGTQRSAISCTACDLCEGTASCGDVTVTLTTAITLGAGDHTIAVIDPSGASGNCLASNDFGWSKLTLLSTATTDSIMLSQRRHVGDNDDTDDDYDFTSISGNSQFYPDADEGSALGLSFTLGATRRLNSVRLYRMRDVNSTDGTVSLNGTQIGTLTANGDPFTVSTSVLLAPGTHTVTVTSGTLSGQRDDQSWDGVILRFADTFSAGAAGFFNAVDEGGNALSGSITTKFAGGGFTLDLYALSGFGSGQDMTFNGIASVELLDASNSSGTTDVYGCNSTWTVAQSLGSVIFVAGYTQVSGTFLDAGLKDARIRVTDLTTLVQGCSIDNFAIRPATLDIDPSHATESTAGTTTALTSTATSGPPWHKAGRPFTVIATGRTAGGAAVTNYDGSPTEATPVVIGPATAVGTFSLGGSWGAASGGARRVDTATYSEVGAVTISLEDAAWANVDADDPTSTAAQRTITGSVDAGRFVPDHFKVADGTLAPACAGGFSYLGSELAWATPAVTLTAENAGNTTTQNYKGALASLPTALAQPGYAVPVGMLALNTTGLADPTISAPANGVATITLPSLSFPRTLVAAFDAQITITLPVFDDADDIVPTESPIVLSGPAGAGVEFTGNGRSQRFGRLYFEPKYGSELLPLDVPLRAEYYDGVTFVPNVADSCTSLNVTDITLTPAVAGQTKSLTAHGGGRWTVTLGAPLIGGQAGLSIDIPTVPYPLLYADQPPTDGIYAEDPATTVTFGVHSQDDKRIYSREVVGGN